MKRAIREVALWLVVLCGVIGLLGLQAHLDGEPDTLEATASRRL